MLTIPSDKLKIFDHHFFQLGWQWCNSFDINWTFTPPNQDYNVFVPMVLLSSTDNTTGLTSSFRDKSRHNSCNTKQLGLLLLTETTVCLFLHHTLLLQVTYSHQVNGGPYIQWMRRKPIACCVAINLLLLPYINSTPCIHLLYSIVNYSV